jgi:cytoskeleton protein RodZ
MFIEEQSINNSQELKAAREALGLSHADVFQRTRISVSNLQAMENNDFHLLPTSAYTKNFIKTYARTLGIDSEPILVKYENYLNSLKGIQKLPPEDVSGSKLLLAKISTRKFFLGIAAVLIVISIVVWLISKQYQSTSDIIHSKGSLTAAATANKEQMVTPPVNETAPVNQQVKDSSKPGLNEINKQPPVKENLISDKTENKAVNSSKEQASLPDAQSAANGEEAGLLIINAIEDTWIRIKADQNPSFQVLLKPGEKFERKAASLQMDIGNAGGIKIHFRGKNIDNLGKSGQVTHLRLP